MKDKIELLRKADIFSRLKKEDLEVVARYSEYNHFYKGQIIFNEGSHEEGLYIIKDGGVLIKKHKTDNKEINLAHFISGECFGEMDLLKNAPRNATAIAEKDTTLLVFPIKGILFRIVLQKHPEISARILHKLLSIIAGRIRNTNKLISEKSPWIRDLRRQLFSDELTGLYNNSFLEDDFVTHLPEFGDNTSLIMLKPDHFKRINDNYGHDAGDKVLRMIAIFIQSILREDDIGIRYRGNEFAIVLPNTEIKDALIIAEEIRSTLKGMDISYITDEQVPNITLSIGVATYPIHAKNNVELTQKAKIKMFEARNNGGNRVLSN